MVLGLQATSFQAVKVAYGELIDGVAKKGKVYPVNIFTKTIFDRFTIYTSDYVNAIEWLIGNYSVPKLGPPPKGIRVINLSIRFLNKGCGELEKKAFNDANNANVVVVVSAGNQNKETSSQAPAVCALHSPNVISVAALGPSGKRASYSNYGDYTTIAAPGGDRKDAIIPPATTNLIRTTGENAYDNVAGTSFASPEVAGVALLVATINPALNPAEIKGILTATAAPFKGYPSNPTFDCNIAPRTCGAGVVDAQAAVLLAQYAASASYKAYFDAPQLELTSFKNPLSICPAGEYVPSQQSISDSDDGISVVWRLNNTPSPGCKPISSYQPLSVINKNGVITANYGSAVSYTLNKNGHTCNLFMLPTTNEEIVGCA